MSRALLWERVWRQSRQGEGVTRPKPERETATDEAVHRLERMEGECGMSTRFASVLQEAVETNCFAHQPSAGSRRNGYRALLQGQPHGSS